MYLGALLFLGGAVGAIWRSRSHKLESSEVMLPALSDAVPSDGKAIDPAQFDDVGELRHYQKVSWYAMALSSSGWLFYPPVSILAIPLLGYNSLNYIRSLKQSHTLQRRSALTLFEIIGIFGTLLTTKPIVTSSVMLLAFGRRNLLLQAGNISNNMHPSQALRFRDQAFWVLREGVEIEVLGVELQDSDIVVFNAGDVISLEGIVVDGWGEVNQFGLNKKMKSLQKSVGDKVYPFTQLRRGTLHIKQ